MAAYVVAVPAIQVTVGARMWFLEHGTVVPEGVDDETITRLVDGGFITEVQTDEEEPEAAPEPDPEDVVPLEKLTKAQLVELAASEGIDLGKATKNEDIVAAILAARDAATEAADQESPTGGSDL
jgi:hypothetical protein